jgi:phage terminase small subunit
LAVRKAGKPSKKAKRKPEPTQADDGLSVRQRLFADCYIGECRFNGTAAARKAGYSGNDNALAVRASELLRIRKVRDYIAGRLDEAAMTANEVLYRLSEIARGRVTDFINESGKFDLEQAKRSGKDGLLKKLKNKSTSKKVDKFTEGEEEEAETFELSLIHEEVEFEMYSAHEALRDLGKYHKLFAERHEHTGKDGGPIEFKRADEMTDDELARIASGAK